MIALTRASGSNLIPNILSRIPPYGNFPLSGFSISASSLAGTAAAPPWRDMTQGTPRRRASLTAAHASRPPAWMWITSGRKSRTALNSAGE